MIYSWSGEGDISNIFDAFLLCVQACTNKTGWDPVQNLVGYHMTEVSKSVETLGSVISVKCNL